MKIFKVLFLAIVAVLFAASSSMAFDCTKIQSGTLIDAKGYPIKTGYDQYGYNYQAHMFNGLYENYTRPTTPVTEGSVNLIMKWSDEWLSNLDCNGDKYLDRGLDLKTGLVPELFPKGTSKGWLTNHEEGDYPWNGESCHYTYFVKIVFVGPVPLAPEQDMWAGKRIWGVYAIIEEVLNDPCGGYADGYYGGPNQGLLRDSLVNPAGLGYYTN